jgi:hypothetical protein
LRLRETTAIAFARLASLGGLQFLTSHKSHEEILRTSDSAKNAMLQFVFTLVTKTQFRVLEWGGAIGAAPLGAVPLGGSWTDQLLTDLREIFDQDDAEHITHAARANCHYFLTLDEATILSRARKHNLRLEKLCPNLTFVSPEDLVELIEKERAAL